MNVIHAIQNYILYFTPLYLLVLRVWSDRLHIQEWLDWVFFPVTVIIGTVGVFLLFLWNPIWNNQLNLIFYTIGFIILYIILRAKDTPFFNAFFYSTLAIFSIAEVWEIPIIVNCLFQHDFIFNLAHLFLASLKLISVPIFIYYVRKDFTLDTSQNNVIPFLSIYLILTSVVLILLQRFPVGFAFWMSVKIALLSITVLWFLGMSPT